MPVCSAISRDGTKVFGSSMASPDTHIVHYFERSNDEELRFDDQTSEVINCAHRITAVAINEEGDRLFAGAIANRFASQTLLCVVKLGGDFEEIDTLGMQENEFGKIRCIKIVPGTDIMIIGGEKKIGVVDAESDQLELIMVYHGLHEFEVIDIAFINDTIFSKGLKEDWVSCIKLNQSKLIKNVSDTKLSLLRDPDEYNQAIYTPNIQKLEISKKVRPPEHCIETSPGIILEKITVSENLNHIFVGGNGIQAFTRQSGDSDIYELSRILPKMSTPNLNC